MKLLRNIRVSLNSEIDLKRAIARKLKIKPGEIEKATLQRKSLDARKRNQLLWQLTAQVELKADPKHPDLLEQKQHKPYLRPQKKLQDIQPYIVGAGPAGLFAALELVKKGFKPIIFEQGDPIEQREKKIRSFWQGGELDEKSNIQNGEGGAGTFSDGKLTARNRDYYTEIVQKYLVQFGAPKSILIEAHPHLGTDLLKKIIRNMREYLIEQGCEIYWQHTLSDIQISDARVSGVLINNEIHKPEILILAVGNSARSIFRILAAKNLVEARPVAFGFRIEHEQSYLNDVFYGEKTDISLTGPAEYRIKAKAGNKQVFSFCMCPGGIIVNASSEKGCLVTNGMSWSKRAGRYGNAAIVVPVQPNVSNSDPLQILKLQEEVEARSYNISGSYLAPVQAAGAYINKAELRQGLKCTFLPGIKHTALESIYPNQIRSDLQSALRYWDKRYPYFARKGLLAGVETRTSSPVRICREKGSFACRGVENLFPIGEGSGYASGIISSAADGVKLAALFYT